MSIHRDVNLPSGSVAPQAITYSYNSPWKEHIELRNSNFTLSPWTCNEYSYYSTTNRNPHLG
eukprot:2030436-Amphidinium_carterae.1